MKIAAAILLVLSGCRYSSELRVEAKVPEQTISTAPHGAAVVSCSLKSEG